MRVVAIANFHPLGLARPIRPGEVLEAKDDVAREWMRLGFVQVEPAAEAADKAVKAPDDKAVKAPAEKAVRRPREKR